MQHTRDQLIEALFENMNSVKRGFYGRMQNLTRDFAISGAQLELLFTIRHNQPVSSKQLAGLLHMTPGAVSQLADSIEQQSLIERHTSEKDRRVQFLRVSEKGEKFIRSFEKSRRKVMEAIIKDLSDGELEIWLRVQQKMIAYFKSEATE
jgi:DNA-binding MarR family transcriptional regulator